MGRHYRGDIEGKFWFGVQESTDANFFGVKGEVEDIVYHFGENQLEDINKGLDSCYDYLGENRKRLKLFFKERDMYDDEELIGYWKKEYNEDIDVKEILLWYARMILGEKIKKSVEEKGHCYFKAEV